MLLLILLMVFLYHRTFLHILITSTIFRFTIHKMKSSHLALLFSSILTFIFFLILWVVDYSPFNIPEIIPVLELQTYSVLTFLAIIVAVIVCQKQLIKHNTN